MSNSLNGGIFLGGFPTRLHEEAVGLGHHVRLMDAGDQRPLIFCGELEGVVGHPVGRLFGDEFYAGNQIGGDLVLDATVLALRIFPHDNRVHFSKGRLYAC